MSFLSSPYPQNPFPLRRQMIFFRANIKSRRFLFLSHGDIFALANTIPLKYPNEKCRVFEMPPTHSADYN